MVLAVVLWIPWARGPIDLRWDAGVYYILGTSLAEGNGYRLLNEPGNPEAIQYPPLLPIFIASQERLLGTSDPVIVGKWLRLIYQLMLMGCAALTYLLARRWSSRWPAFLAGVIFLLSLHTYFMGSLAFSEVPFTLVSLLFFAPSRSTKLASVGEGICAIAAYLLRTIGIALLLTWIAEVLVRLEWKKAAVRAAVVLVPLLLWQGYVHRVEDSESYRHPAYAYQRAPYQFYNVAYSRNIAYVDPFRPQLGLISRGQTALRTVNNLLLERRSFAEAVTTNFGFWGIIHSWIPQVPNWTFHLGQAACAYAITILIMVGLAMIAWRGEFRIPVYVGLSALAIAATPWPAQFSRYFWPLSPLLAIAFIVGAETASDFAGLIENRRAARMVRVALMTIVLVAISVESAVMVFNWFRPDVKVAIYVDPHNTRHPYRLLYYNQSWADFDRAIDWIKEHAPSNAVVGTVSPHYLYLRSQRKAVMPPMENDPATAQLLLDSVPATYLIADDLTFMGDVIRAVVDGVARQYPAQWKEVAIVPGSSTVIYQRIGGPSPAAPPAP